MQDPLSERYQRLLHGAYDCVDRIVLNAYFRPGHSGGGFRHWWRELWGSDDKLDTTHLMRMAGRFSRRVRAFAKAKGIPLREFAVGERKHDQAEEYLATHEVRGGIFLIMISRAQAPVWEADAKNHHLEWKHPQPYVNHYSFHILDPDWGHLTIKISGHPPFPAQVILNGHEYVACQARKAGIDFTKEGNCFTHTPDAAGLARVADTLSEPQTIGRLTQVCERWIYTCVSFALDSEEQQQTGFRYQYSVYQMEYSHNLLFQVGAQMEQVFQALVDRSRVRLGVREVKTILGRKHRPKYRPRQKETPEWSIAIERPAYNLTVFRIRCGKLTLKIYTKGERVLRAEGLVHNTRELDLGRDLPNFTRILARLQEILRRFVETLAGIDACFINDQRLEQLPLPGRVGQTRVGGIDLSRARMRKVVEAILALSCLPRGFSASQLAAQVQAAGLADYGPRRASYDLKKFRAKELVRKIARSRRYQAPQDGLRALAAVVILRDHVIQPLLAAASSLDASQQLGAQTKLDQHYQRLREDMQGLFQELGVAA